MAAFMGPAEVAAWSILGSIWDVLYYTTAGIADSGEIRVANHLGDGMPKLAELSAYKSLLIGMIIAILTSTFYFSVQNVLPTWFTHDETLIKMLRELVPFVGVANLSMTFGMQSWSLIGAQGKYKVATWVNFAASWGVTMPLAAILVFAFRIDLQGLMSASTIGYTTCGATLSYLLLSTDWEGRARKIQERNAEIEEGTIAPEDDDDSDAAEEMWAALPVRGAATNTGPLRGVRIVILPAFQRCGILFGNIPSKGMTPYVMEVRHWSPFYGRIHPGDALLSIGGEDARTMTTYDIASMLDTKKSSDCEMVFVTQTYRDEEDEGVAEESEENAPSSRNDGDETPAPASTSSGWLSDFVGLRGSETPEGTSCTFLAPID